MNNNRRKDLIIRVCCFIAAFILWLYISNIENPMKSTVIKDVSVTIVNTDVLSQFNLVELPKQNYSVSITVKGPANEIYGLKTNQFKVTADLSGYALKKGENRIPVEISEHPSNINIVNNDLWVKIKLDDLVEKNVPVKVKLSGSPKEKFVLSEPIITPNNVLISGPAQYVNSVSYAKLDINLEGISTNIEDTYYVKAVDNLERKIEDVKIEPSYVKVEIPLKNVKSIPVNVDLDMKANDDFVVKSINTTPNKIQISGDSELLDQINQISTEKLKLSDIKDGNTIEVPLIIPDGIKILDDINKVKVKIELSQVIQKKLSVKLAMQNLSDGYEAAADNPLINVYISGGTYQLSTIKNEDIKCYADFNELGEGSYELPVIVEVPDYVTKFYYDPKNVKVTIKKKEVKNVNGNQSQ